MSNKASGTVIILIIVEKVIYFVFCPFVVNHVSSTSVQIYEHICVLLGVCVCVTVKMASGVNLKLVLLLQYLDS